MAYSTVNSKGDTYYLHVNMRKLKSGADSPLYYFSRELKPEKALDAIPEGKIVVELKTGLPALKNK